jgi:type IV pilus assembly protein PilX
MAKNLKLYFPGRQRGVVLVVALVILLMMAMIGVTSLQGTGLQQRMSNNLRDATVALQTAETALRVAELSITGLTNTAAFTTTGPYYTQGNAPNPLSSATWSGAGTVTATGSYGSARAPQYFIELEGLFSPFNGTASSIASYGQGNGNLTTVFRIVARGTGGTGTSQVILEEFYGRTF